MALEEGIDLWLVDQLEQLDAAQMDEIAATVSALYRRVAETPVAPQPVRRGVSKKGKPG